MVCWSGWGVGVAIIGRVLQLDGIKATLHMGPSGHDGSCNIGILENIAPRVIYTFTFGILPQFFGGEHSGCCNDVVAYDAVVRVVRET